MVILLIFLLRTDYTVSGLYPTFRAISTKSQNQIAATI